MITEQNRINAEEALAKLIGAEWCPGTTMRRTGQTWDHWDWIGSVGYHHPVTKSITQPTRRWIDCGPLIIEHQLIVDCDDISEAGCVEVQWRDRAGMLNPVNAYYADHPSKESAVMYAVVLAVTRKLEARKS